jgi:hypothetical protein
VTGPVSGGYERGTGAPSRSTGIQGTAGAILVVLALGLALRLILAYLLPRSGFDADLGSFQFWASNLAKDGLNGFYERPFFHDYTPGYLYVLWLVGIVGRALGGIGDLIKIPPVLGDLAIGYLVWSMIRELGGRERLALLGAAWSSSIRSSGSTTSCGARSTRSASSSSCSGCGRCGATSRNGRRSSPSSRPS